jgi:hypothetical protein
MLSFRVARDDTEKVIGPRPLDPRCMAVSVTCRGLLPRHRAGDQAVGWAVSCAVIDQVAGLDA